jgi:hypothetical protein
MTERVIRERPQKVERAIRFLHSLFHPPFHFIRLRFLPSVELTIVSPSQLELPEESEDLIRRLLQQLALCLR